MKAIPVYGGYFTVVDDFDYETMSKFKWHISKSDQSLYARRGCWINNKTKCFYMHKELFGNTGTMVIHHINGNGLDNRRCNLRLCTTQQNTMSRFNKGHHHTSRFKGVHLLKNVKVNKWRACITFNGKTLSLGVYPTELEASMKYDEAARDLHGNFAVINKYVQLT